MAAEAKRGCGYRKHGNIYLIGGCIGVPCDRVPLPLKSCPTCGGGIHYFRSYKWINPLDFFGTHDVLYDEPQCIDEPRFRPCHLCDPGTNPAILMMVGERNYKTPDIFMNEARLQGISKRIIQIPRGIKLGETVVYLAHNKACKEEPPAEPVEPERLIDAPKKKVSRLGVFTAFIPQRIEKIYWESEVTDEVKEDCAKRGITPVGLPDGDPDHVKNKRYKEVAEDRFKP
jgi:hypothetical protein